MTIPSDPVMKKVTFTLCFLSVSRMRPVSSFPQEDGLLMDRFWHLTILWHPDGLITKDEYRQYRDKYEQQIEAASAMLAKIGEVKEQQPENGPWIERLLQHRELSQLDRNIVVEMVQFLHPGMYFHQFFLTLFVGEL